MNKTLFIMREVYPIVCPECKLNGMINADQQAGRIGIMCPVCGWHTIISSKQKVKD